ncbi:MAG: hypothetical protein IJN00_03405, partial [Clostridia bacterium]|nr:hypothetical protein [Clostridia bacterium]
GEKAPNYPKGDASDVNAMDALNNATAGEGKVETPADPGDDYMLIGMAENGQGSVVPDSEHSDAGNNIVINVKPAAGMRLKEGTLKAVYKVDGKEITYTMSKNAAGQYVLLMPAANVLFKAEFEKAPAAAPDAPPAAANEQNTASSTSGMQVTGALAIAVGLNTNNAVIDTTGSITAGGKLAVDADGLMQSNLIADASPMAPQNTREVVGAERPSTPEMLPGDAQITPEQSVTVTVKDPDKANYESIYNVTIGATTFGSVAASVDALEFTVTPQSGFRLERLQLSYTTKDGKVITLNLVKNAEGKYVLPAGAEIASDDLALKVGAIFEGDPHTVTVGGGAAGSVSGVPTTVKSGETVKFNIAVPEGQNVKITADGVTVTEKDGFYTFTMPTKDITNNVEFADKENEVRLASGADVFVKAPARADADETVTVALTDYAVNSGKGYTITAMIVDPTGLTQPSAIAMTGNTFKMPELGSGYYVEISVTEGEQKGHQITTETVQNGSFVAPSYADAEEKIEIRVNPAAGYKLKENSLTVTVSVSGNASSQKVITPDANGKYYFTLPNEQMMTMFPISITGVFEKDPNYKAPTAPTTPAKQRKSVGIGAAAGVNIVLYESTAAIKAGTV